MNKSCATPDVYSRIIDKTLDKTIPFKVDWELTYRCNLSCAHCYQTGPTPEPELSTQEVFSVLDQLADLGCLYITFTGGEILLREDFFEIARYARKKEFALRLFTNATLIDEPMADKIKELNPLAVEISLYGLDPAVHEKITQIPGSYRRTINALDLLKQRRINIVVKATLIKDNVGEFYRLKEFAEQLGARFRFSLTVIPRIDGSREVLNLRLTEEELTELVHPESYFVQGVTKGGVRNYQPLCAAGFNCLYISPYGEVFPCVVLRESCGNLRKLPLAEIWQAPIFRQLRRIEFKDLKQCSSCSLAEYCDRCAGLAWGEQGGLLGASTHDCVLAGVRRQAIERRDKDARATEAETAQALQQA